jgi:hypothetical protein
VLLDRLDGLFRAQIQLLDRLDGLFRAQIQLLDRLDGLFRAQIQLLDRLDGTYPCLTAGTDPLSALAPARLVPGLEAPCTCVGIWIS